MINSTKKIKLWTLACYSFMVIAGGHGAGFLIMFQVLMFINLVENNFIIEPGGSVEILVMFCMIPLAGQIMLVLSKFLKNLRSAVILHITSLTIFFLSAGYIFFAGRNPDAVRLVRITAIPLAICIVRTFFNIGKYVRQMWRWALDE